MLILCDLEPIIKVKTKKIVIFFTLMSHHDFHVANYEVFSIEIYNEMYKLSENKYFLYLFNGTITKKKSYFDLFSSSRITLFRRKYMNYFPLCLKIKFQSSTVIHILK